MNKLITKLITGFFIIILSFLLFGQANAGGNIEWAGQINKYAFCSEEGNRDSCIVYTFYIPENIIQLEYLFMLNKLPGDSYEYRLVRLNTLLIKSGEAPLYY